MAGRCRNLTPRAETDASESKKKDDTLADSVTDATSPEELV